MDVSNIKLLFKCQQEWLPQKINIETKFVNKYDHYPSVVLVTQFPEIVISLLLSSLVNIIGWQVLSLSYYPSVVLVTQSAQIVGQKSTNAQPAAKQSLVSENSEVNLLIFTFGILILYRR